MDNNANNNYQTMFNNIKKIFNFLTNNENINLSVRADGNYYIKYDDIYNDDDNKISLSNKFNDFIKANIKDNSSLKEIKRELYKVIPNTLVITLNVQIKEENYTLMFGYDVQDKDKTEFEHIISLYNKSQKVFALKTYSESIGRQLTIKSFNGNEVNITDDGTYIDDELYEYLYRLHERIIDKWVSTLANQAWERLEPKRNALNANNKLFDDFINHIDNLI
jgi:hypothetical protein